jgi:hypothetical protein
MQSYQREGMSYSETTVVQNITLLADVSVQVNRICDSVSSRLQDKKMCMKVTAESNEIKYRTLTITQKL